MTAQGFQMTVSRSFFSHKYHQMFDTKQEHG
jgi:hypothetical protein